MTAKDGLTAKQENLVVGKKGKNAEVTPLADPQWRSVLLLQKRRSLLNE